MSTVLVVEDQAETRRPLARLLKQEGYEVLTAINAYEAMAAVRNCQPDMILLDVGIPPMDGLTCLMLLREENPSLHIPVVLVTGSSDPNTIERAKALGVKGHLLKSHYTAEELLSLVRQHAGPPATGQAS